MKYGLEIFMTNKNNKVMKANAPEKIYMSPAGVLYKGDKQQNNDIEYTRTDAFIEKAETYLKEQFAKDVSVLAGGVVSINFDAAISNFVKYMKG